MARSIRRGGARALDPAQTAAHKRLMQISTGRRRADAAGIRSRLNVPGKS
jgi:hypothetical protein